MIEKLKQYPLIGLALAVAAGMVLAHIVNGLGNHLWNSFQDDPEDIGWAIADITFLAATAWLILRKRRTIAGWFRRYGGKVGIIMWWSVFSVYFLVILVTFLRHVK